MKSKWIIAFVVVLILVVMAGNAFAFLDFSKLSKRGDPVIAVLRLNVFHRPDCPLLKDVPKALTIKLRDKDEALKFDYKACDKCKP